MSGRNKRLAAAFLRKLSLDIWLASERLEELRSEWEWKRTGPQGFADELRRRLGGDVEVRVADPWTVPSLCLGLELTYRGNRIAVRVEAEDAMSRRSRAMTFCLDPGRKLKRYPCTHPGRPVKREKPLPPIPIDPDWMNQPLPEFLVVEYELACPDCNAVVG